MFKLRNKHTKEFFAGNNKSNSKNGGRVFTDERFLAVYLQDESFSEFEVVKFEMVELKSLPFSEIDLNQIPALVVPNWRHATNAKRNSFITNILKEIFK